MLKPWISGLQAAYQRYVDDYREYLQLRGFGTHVNDWFFVKRGFVECWWEPGFHCFWQVWNPGIGYFTYKFYLTLGGNKRQNLATITAFVINGLIHNMVVIPFLQRWDFPLPFIFFFFWFIYRRVSLAGQTYQPSETAGYLPFLHKCWIGHPII